MEHIKIAALLTCFNRKEKTLASLLALFNQDMPTAIELSVYLVDDGSTDGTSEAVGAAYGQVKIISGDGNLYWGGGMRLAFETAMKADPDYYLWLNDDTILYPNAVKTLLETSQRLSSENEKPALVAASTRDAETGEFTYGGMIRRRWWRPLNLDPLMPKDEPQPCLTICGNCVLIPRAIVQKIGNLDAAFVHYAGDWDYGLRAKKEGFGVWVAGGYLGTCSANPKPAQKTSDQLQQELKKVDQPKGLTLQDGTLQPMQEWKVLASRHAGPFWPFYWLIPYRRVLWIALVGRFSGKRG